jgi:lipid-binding SYLF domain-containing protein
MTRLIALISAAALLLAANIAGATSKLDTRVETATEILNDLNRIPEQAIPAYLLNRAYAVAVVPSVVRAGAFLVGGSFGKGIIVVRRPDGSWSNPAFIRLGNASFGPQFGVQGADLILVFKSRRGVEQIAEGKLTLGGTAAASAGPVGRTAVAATDGRFQSEIYTYARSRGLFAGISLDGGGITMDSAANAAYYGSTDAAAWRILNDASIPTPVSAQEFIARLGAMAPRLQWQDGARNAQNAPSSQPADTGAKTYAVEETTAQPAPETMF